MLINLLLTTYFKYMVEIYFSCTLIYQLIHVRDVSNETMKAWDVRGFNLCWTTVREWLIKIILLKLSLTIHFIYVTWYTSTYKEHIRGVNIISATQYTYLCAFSSFFFFFSFFLCAWNLCLPFCVALFLLVRGVNWLLTSWGWYSL